MPDKPPTLDPFRRELLSRYELLASTCALTPVDVDRMNGVLQLSIESTTDEAMKLALAQVKFLLNKRFDEARRGAARKLAEREYPK